MQSLSYRSSYFPCILFTYLISKGPHNNRRVITVSTDKGTCIRLVPIRKDEMKIVWRFLCFPRIKDFVDNQKAHFISQMQYVATWGVMCRTNGICAHFL